MDASSDLDREVIEAVTEYVYHRHGDLNTSNVFGFDKEELARIKTENSYLVFSVEDVHIAEKQVQDAITLYYVAATLVFQVTDGGEPIEGSTDIYQCYRCWDAHTKKQVWCIEWHSS